MRYLILLSLLLIGCGSDHSGHIKIDSTTHTIILENPITEYCERLYPEVLHPDIIERETLITECMILCSESGDCVIDIPTNLPQQ